LEDQEGDKN